MAKTLANCAIWFDQLEIDSSVNKVLVQMSNAELIATTFADSAVRRLSGLGDSSIVASGFADWPDPDNTIVNDVGVLVPVSVVMGGNVVGNVAYCLNAEVASYGPGATIGGILGFSMKAAGSDLIGNGFLAQTGNVTANGNSAVYALTAPPDNLHAVIAAMHVTSFGGTTPSLTVSLQSAPTAGFGAPTTRASFNVMNNIGSGYVRAPGPITDGFWRLLWTIAGGGGQNFTWAGVIGYGS